MSEPQTADDIERLIVPHGPNGECTDPELCVLLTEFRVAIEAQAAREWRRKYEGMVKERDDQVHRKRVARKKVAEAATPDVERLLAKAEKWRAAGMFTESEWGAVMAVLFVGDVESLSDEDRQWAIGQSRRAGADSAPSTGGRR